jgi:hypothetical protein
VNPFVAVIAVLGGAFLIVTAFMWWAGLMSLLTPRSLPRHTGCGHLKAISTADRAQCWRCRHRRLDHALHISARPLHHAR